MRSFAQVAYSSSQAELMYATAGSVCQLAPLVPTRNVPGGGVVGVDAGADGVPSVTIAAIATAASAEIHLRFCNAVL